MNLSLAELERLKRRLRIDKHALDEELIEQPTFFFEVSERVAYAKAVRDETRRNRDVTSAEIKSELRESEEKIAENRLTSMVDQDEEYIEARANYHDAEKQLALWEALAEAVKTRGYMLRQLADLFVANYYSPNSAGESPTSKRAKSERRVREPYKKVSELKEKSSERNPRGRRSNR